MLGTTCTILVPIQTWYRARLLMRIKAWIVEFFLIFYAFFNYQLAECRLQKLSVEFYNCVLLHILHQSIVLHAIYVGWFYLSLRNVHCTFTSILVTLTNKKKDSALHLFWCPQTCQCSILGWSLCCKCAAITLSTLWYLLFARW